MPVTTYCSWATRPPEPRGGIFSPMVLVVVGLSLMANVTTSAPKSIRSEAIPPTRVKVIYCGLSKVFPKRPRRFVWCMGMMMPRRILNAFVRIGFLVRQCSFLGERRFCLGNRQIVDLVCNIYAWTLSGSYKHSGAFLSTMLHSCLCLANTAGRTTR